jgi:UDP-N-acetylmuramoyl-tripeptide--D-alanyl-D-alanine ligase
MTIEQLYSIYKNNPKVQTDTRKLQAGEIFFALKGDNFDANTFTTQALEQGAAAVIIDNTDYYVNDKTIVVPNVLETLQQLALHHRRQFSIPFIAITGSNGKTTTKELLYTALSSKYITYCTAGNFNNHIGVPLTLLSIKMDAQMAIIEMGANHQKEIASYCTYTEPTHVLINNCGEAHLEGFGGIEGVRKGKGELYDYAAANNCPVFYNNDLDYLQTMINDRGISNTISYGSNNAQYLAKLHGNFEQLQVAVLNKGMECIIHTQLFGDYNLANVQAAIAVGSTFNVPIMDIKNAIELYTPTNSRSQMTVIDTNKIIMDAYNANPTSMRAAILNFAAKDYPNKIIMLGGMKEVGAENETQKHQEIIDLLQQWNWNLVVLVGPEFAKTKHNFKHFNTSAVAGAWFKTNQFSNTAILVKGSRGSKMELAVS